MTRTTRILVIASVMTDMTVVLDRVPADGETVQGRSFAIGCGGKGANQAVMAALLGADVDVVACVGDDSFGEQAAHNLESFGVGAAGVRVVPGIPTGVAPIWVDATGGNRIVIVPGANLEMTVEQVDAAFEGETPDVVICQLEVPLACVRRALERGRAVAAITLLNPAPAVPVPTEVLQLASWLIPNESEFETLIEQELGRRPDRELENCVRALARALGTRLAVTVGERGALVCDRPQDGVTRLVKAVAATAVDTSGAGDAFVGAFAYALGCGASGTEAAALACACASDSVTRAGTQASFPRGARLASLAERLTTPSLSPTLPQE